MNTDKRRCWARIAVIAAGFVANSITTLLAQDDGAPGSETKAEAPRPVRIEEIVTRARRRDEFIQDTPLSVTAITANTLRESNVQRLDDIQNLVPNLRIEGGAQGIQSTVIIRGIGAGSPDVTFEQGVGTYVDGVFLPRTFGLLTDVLDIEQIEVLRGPQGTLFGKNTTGGAILVHTKKPDDELAGSVLIRAGRFDSVRTESKINIPLIDDLLFSRFAFASDNTGGYFTDLQQDTRHPESSRLSFLGSLRLLPHDDVTVDLSGSWTRSHATIGGADCEYQGGGSLEALFSPDPTFDLRNACQDFGRPFSGRTNVPGLVDLESYGIWSNTSWNVGEVLFLDDLDIKFIGSWRSQLPRLRQDFDGTPLTVVKVSDYGGDSLEDGVPGFQDQYQAEFQFNSAAWEERINTVIGVFSFWEKARRSATTTSGPLPGGVQPIRQDLTNNRVDTSSWALFGQSTIDFTEWLHLTGGVRYTEERKEISLEVTGILADPIVTPPATNGRLVFDDTSWMGSLQLTLPDDWKGDQVDDLMTYFTYSQGFRGGGFNSFVSNLGSLDAFGPEHIENFEVGFKGNLLDRRLAFSLSGFIMPFKDIQVVTTGSIPDPDAPGGFRVERFTQNAAKATSQGIELDLEAAPIEGLSLAANVGHLQAKYDKFFDGFTDPTVPPVDRSGETIQSIPEWRTYLRAQYSLPIETQHAELDGYLVPRLEWTYTDTITYNGNQIQSPTHLLHARLAYQFWDDQLEIAAWGRNLTDETYFNQSTVLFSVFGTGTRFFQSPRTYGGEVSFRF